MEAELFITFCKAIKAGVDSLALSSLDKLDFKKSILT
jgi:hypothetical protein